MNADDILRLLDRRFPTPQWMRVRELAHGGRHLTPSGPDKAYASIRSIDFAALERSPASENRFVAVEVKASRADAIAELAHPEKAAPFVECAHEFWLATPPSLVRISELPDGWGLLEVSGDHLRAVHRAKYYRSRPGPTKDMLRRMLYQKERHIEESEGRFASLRGRDLTLEQVRRLCDDYFRRHRRDVEDSVRAGIAAERRERTVRDAQVARMWRDVLRDAFDFEGDPTGDQSVRAMRVLADVENLRRTLDRVAQIKQELDELFR